MQALDWLFEKEYFEAIDLVGFAHDPKSQLANTAVHHPLHVATANVHLSCHALVAVSSPICCMPYSWTVT